MTSNLNYERSIKGIPASKWARWYCELNCHRWPDDFPFPKPESLNNKTSRQIFDSPEMLIAFRAVSCILSEKEKSRAWHMLGYTGKSKTEEEWAAWWEGEDGRFLEANGIINSREEL